MTIVSEKIIEVREDIASGPDNVIQTRLGVINAIELSKEVIINSSANVLSTTQNGSSKTLPEIIQEQAEIRTYCEGANSSSIVNFDDLGNTTMYDTSTVSFTFPVANTSICKFGVQILTNDGANEVTLSNIQSGTGSITASNGYVSTFSTFFDDYYFVQSRQTGSLIATSDSNNMNAVILPNAIKPLGANAEFGKSGQTNTWNEYYAPMNIDNIETVDGVTYVTMERPLADGSESNYKKPELYAPLVLKRKHKTPEDKADTQAFVAIVVCEGLQINTNWLPVGDIQGSYADTNADTYKCVLLDNVDFISRLGVFETSTYNGNTLPVYKSLSNTEQSTAQEIPMFSGTYPDKEIQPFFPYVDKKAELQPGGLTENDVFCGRYVHIERNRTAGETTYDEETETITLSGGEAEEYRFVTDNASKFFWRTNPLLSLSSTGSYSTQTSPSFSDPQHEFQSDMGIIILGESNKTQNSIALSTSSHLYTGQVEDGWSSGNVFPSSTWIPSTSNASTLSIVPSLQANNDGIIVTSGPADLTITANTSHYYYLISTNTDDILTYSKLLVSYVTSSNVTHNIIQRTVNFSTIEAPLLYNQVQNFLISANGAVVNTYINGLYDRRNYNDPFFEDDAGEVGFNVEAQANYNTFVAGITSLKTSWDDLKTAQNSHRWVLVNNNYNSAETGLNYNTSVWSDEWASFSANLVSFEAVRNERIDTISRRIGVPTWVNQLAPNDRSNTKTAVAAASIPTVDVSGGAERLLTEDGYNLLDELDNSVMLEGSFWSLVSAATKTPYGRKIYDAINILLDLDIGVLRDTTDKVNAIQFAFDKIKQDRNIYEVLNNRSKQAF